MSTSVALYWTSENISFQISTVFFEYLVIIIHVSSKFCQKNVYHVGAATSQEKRHSSLFIVRYFKELNDKINR